ncbi:uncharacterized protein [Temnothorax longispinosus]|uniref:uncharacterized protein n=1 Tax=Temnothorax longispinosus TaxID=300112 RepID=UPI003A9A03A3
MPSFIPDITINGNPIQYHEIVKFLGIFVDCALSGKPHFTYVINKCRKALNIMTALAGVWWGAHPQQLMMIYKGIIHSNIDYGCQLLQLSGNLTIFEKLQRIQYKAIRIAFGYRQSTPINVLLDEAKEPPLQFRLKYLTSKLVLKNIAQEFSPVTNSLDELISITRSPNNCEKACKHIPAYRYFRSIIGVTGKIHQTVSLPVFNHSYESTVHIIQYTSFLFDPNISNVNSLFLKETQSLRKDAISFYTDGSKDDSGFVGAGVFSPELAIQIMHKLPTQTSIFTAEAWAILQALITAGQRNPKKIVIFSDSKSVLENICSNDARQQNYIIPWIKEKIYQFSNKGIDLQLAWIPSHRGIAGNEVADKTAKLASRKGFTPDFRIPHCDFYSVSKENIRRQIKEYFRCRGSFKGIFYYTNYHTGDDRPWYHKKPFRRKEIVLVNRLRSGHYNLNYSLARKNIVDSGACPCGNPKQDINHIIFSCALYSDKAGYLIKHIEETSSFSPKNIFLFLNNPSQQLTRLLLAACKSMDLQP